jgi:hypothetical protein
LAKPLLLMRIILPILDKTRMLFHDDTPAGDVTQSGSISVFR